MATEESAVEVQDPGAGEEAGTVDLANPYNIEEPEDEVFFPEEDGDGEQGGDDQDSATTDSDEDGQAQPDAAAEDGDAGISPSLILRAGKLGFTEEEIAPFTTSAALEAAIQFAERRMQDQAGTEEQGVAQADAEATDLLELNREELEESFDERLVDVLMKFSEKHNNSVKQRDALREEMEYERAELFQDRLDIAFDRLDDKWKDVVGKGDRFQLDPSSDQYKNRGKIVGEVLNRMRLDNEKGIQKPIREYVEQSTSSVFADQSEKIARRGIAKDMKRRQSQGINRPSGQKGPDGAGMTPEQIAVRNAAKFMKERGMSPDYEAGDKIEL